MPGKVMVVLPAYNASRTLERTVAEIPGAYVDALVLVDDRSADSTVDVARRLGIPVIEHSENRGYGANQKTCYKAALEAGADVVIMLHPDYQYDPARIPAMLERLQKGDCDVVLGSRMADGLAKAGGMPWWKRVGNRLLTTAQNLLLGTRLTEFHTGYRAFTRRALELSGFERFEDGFVFDAQMLVALTYRGAKVGEIACPARYLPEASSVGFFSSVRYGLGCITVSLRYRMNRLGLFPAGWLAGPDPVPLAQGISPAVLGTLAVGFLALRFLSGVDWASPLRAYDSWGYSLGEMATSRWSLVSFLGDAPRAWPVPLLYASVGSDSGRVLAQMILGAAAWVALASVAAVSLRQRTVANLTALAVLSLGATPQASAWEVLLLPEALSIALSVATVAAFILYWKRASTGRAAAVVLSGGLLAITRPVMAPILLLIGTFQLARTGSPRRFRGWVAGGLVCSMVWLAAISAQQDKAYATFERNVRGASSATYASDTFASVIYGRLLGDPASAAWLASRGAPPLEPGMRVPRYSEDKDGWVDFREAYGRSDEWQEWFGASGGLMLVPRHALDLPITQLRLFTRDLPLILAAPWDSEHFPEYGRGVQRPLLSAPYFRSMSGVPIDLVMLAGLLTSALWMGCRKGLIRRHPLIVVGLWTIGASTMTIVFSWSLVGIELVRHTVPGPLGLRLGLLLALAGSMDALFSGAPELPRATHLSGTEGPI